jgi:hypothetical protein
MDAKGCETVELGGRLDSKRGPLCLDSRVVSVFLGRYLDATFPAKPRAASSRPFRIAGGKEEGGKERESDAGGKKMKRIGWPGGARMGAQVEGRGRAVEVNWLASDGADLQALKGCSCKSPELRLGGGREQDKPSAGKQTCRPADTRARQSQGHLHAWGPLECGQLVQGALARMWAAGEGANQWRL